MTGGTRTLELGTVGGLREHLNGLVLSGAKVATFRHPALEASWPEGERLAVLDNDGTEIATVEVVQTRCCRWAEVTWEMVEAEGEGEASLAHWRQVRAARWEAMGLPRPEDLVLDWIRFRLVDPLPMVPRVTAGDLGLPEGFRHLYSGKVRDLFETPEGDLLFVASDRISAYDWVLPTLIPGKGAILTALSLWWFEQVKEIVGNHVRQAEVPASVADRAMVCRRLDMFPIECVVRGYLTGSAMADYRASGSVCGVEIPAGLVDGSALPQAIFTPATKAQLGNHDENIDFARAEDLIGAEDAAELRRLSLATYTLAADLAASRGIIIADTKFELGRDPESGTILLADEVLTPDSSRFWPVESSSPGRPQPSFDKQFVRDWLRSPESGWDPAGTQPPPPLPPAVVEGTQARYREAYRHLTGGDFEA